MPQKPPALAGGVVTLARQDVAWLGVNFPPIFFQTSPFQGECQEHFDSSNVEIDATTGTAVDGWRVFTNRGEFVLNSQHASRKVPDFCRQAGTGRLPSIQGESAAKAPPQLNGPSGVCPPVLVASGNPPFFLYSLLPAGLSMAFRCLGSAFVRRGAGAGLLLALVVLAAVPMVATAPSR